MNINSNPKLVKCSRHSEGEVFEPVIKDRVNYLTDKLTKAITCHVCGVTFLYNEETDQWFGDRNLTIVAP